MNAIAQPMQAPVIQSAQIVHENRQGDTNEVRFNFCLKTKSGDFKANVKANLTAKNIQMIDFGRVIKHGFMYAVEPVEIDNHTRHQLLKQIINFIPWHKHPIVPVYQIDADWANEQAEITITDEGLDVAYIVSFDGEEFEKTCSKTTSCDGEMLYEEYDVTTPEWIHFSASVKLEERAAELSREYY